MPPTKYCCLGSKSAKHGLVFLHGWKMNAMGMRSSMRSALGDAAELPNTLIYFLTAPHTMDGDSSSPEWFAYTSDDKLNFAASDLMRARRRLIQIIERLHTRHRRRGGTVCLGGYSQGACMALDVALAMEVPTRVALFSGFAMLPRFVSAPSGWHGHSTATVAKAQLQLWILHGKADTEISWGLARRSYEALRELNPEGITLRRVEATEDDHWSVWDGDEAAALLRAFAGLREEEGEGGGDDDGEAPPCDWHWNDLSDAQRGHAALLGYDEDAWYYNAARALSWAQLMGRPGEREAALALGFTRETWLVEEEEAEEEGAVAPPLCGDVEASHVASRRVDSMKQLALPGAERENVAPPGAMNM